jgi:MFS family permease
LAVGGIGIVLFVTSWIPIYLFDKYNRRKWLTIGVCGMLPAMVGITGLQWHAEKHPGEETDYAIIAFPYLFYLFFNISWGVGSWTYSSEIWPIRYRSRGTALSTLSFWLGCFLVAQMSPPIADAIGWGLYIIYAGICVVAFVFVRCAMVETRGKTLEEMSRLFGVEQRFVARRGLPIFTSVQAAQAARAAQAQGVELQPRERPSVTTTIEEEDK